MSHLDGQKRDQDYFKKNMFVDFTMLVSVAHSSPVSSLVTIQGIMVWYGRLLCAQEDEQRSTAISSVSSERIQVMTGSREEGERSVRP